MHQERIGHFMSVLLTFCGAVAGLCATTPSLAATIVISTSDGNGADHFVAEHSGNNSVNMALENRVLVRQTSTRHEVAYLKFDLSSLTESASDVALELFKLAGNNSHDINIYGVNDSFDEAWTAGSITYDNSPGRTTTDGNTSTADLIPAEVTLLGTFSVGSTNDAKSFTSPEMSNFINADTNDMATIFIEFAGGDTSLLTFRSSHITSPVDPQFAPRLAITTVPEPSTIVMVLVGAIGLVGVARRRHV